MPDHTNHSPDSATYRVGTLYGPDGKTIRGYSVARVSQLGPIPVGKPYTKVDAARRLADVLNAQESEEV